MALIDKGMDQEFQDDLDALSTKYFWQNEDTVDYDTEMSRAVEWLLKDAHKSDIGVVHRLIRDKLNA